MANSALKKHLIFTQVHISQDKEDTMGDDNINENITVDGAYVDGTELGFISGATVSGTGLTVN